MYRPGNKIFTLWICLSAAYVALLPQFYQVFDAGNRYTMLWSRTYHVTILCSIALLALLYFIARTVIAIVGNRFGWSRWADFFCLLWMVFLCLRTVSALLVRLETLPPGILHLLWNPWFKLVLYFLLPVPLLILYMKKAKRMLKSLFVGLSILLVLFVVRSAGWTTFEKYNATIDEGGAARKITDGRNILIFFMDEWSFERTFGEKGWEDEYPALASLLKESTLYTQAYTLGGETRVSIPRFLFSNDAEFMRKTFQEVHHFNEKGLRHEGKTLFDLVPDDWLRMAIGFTINYPILLEGKTDLSLRFESENVRRTFRGEFRHLMLSQFSFLRYFGIEYEDAVNPDWYPQMEIHDYAMEVIHGQTCNLLGFFHYAWPHYPYIWTRAGRKPGRISASAVKEHTVDNYMGNLAYMDIVVGEICQALRQSGRWENSLVIFTSDHNWRFDPLLPESRADIEDPNPISIWKHVPLIIKYPGQKTGLIQSKHRVIQGNVARLITAYVEGSPLPEDNDWLQMEGQDARTEQAK